MEKYFKMFNILISLKKKKKPKDFNLGDEDDREEEVGSSMAVSLLLSAPWLPSLPTLTLSLSSFSLQN